MKRILSALAFLGLSLAAVQAVNAQSTGTKATSVPSSTTSSASGVASSEQWRYVRHDGRWWYYDALGHWLVYTDGVWAFYQPTPVSVPQTFAAPVYGYYPSYAPQQYGNPYQYYTSQPGTYAPPGFWNGPNRPGAGWVNGFFSTGGGRGSW
jgi:hypothetical protein